MEDDRMDDAVDLMRRFADRTGITPGLPSRRYLWTDAFAVCNFLGLGRATGDVRYRLLALRLVDQVHHELGRYAPADRRRTGWISGLPDGAAEAHPTRGGLRIGKPLPERGVGEPFDPELEWDRDGQYFHYLTKWMHALDQVSRWTGEPRFHLWARELAQTAHGAFACGLPGHRRMMWKLSVDLSRPLVGSMGQHDPLDGLVTCAQLGATPAGSGALPSLADAIDDFAAMIDPAALATSDPLGLGSLLVDACRLAQLGTTASKLIAPLLGAALDGLRGFLEETNMQAPAEHRLAFRELGLAIGLAAVSMLGADALREGLDAPGRALTGELRGYLPLRKEIESFWRRTQSRSTSTWAEHADINEVMLATSLAPDGFLRLGGIARHGIEAKTSASA
jgi:hypothetical protein